ncbi:uncharacterized protein Z518_01910 [Rhinocladiella mackenziei CBS 650.93]|uniref:Rhinocladiella mackenziei CBS 650.93 unplaced genomic scaffold supercont1.2, whole genome shotgun sequence n=1 Tax=Rhinocladiella mackenziei CBS 650.93 TaxID=1442369 RepID=A0A0D2FY79_9EURO|nr:uncharacterized protein Z518_01910 [Rhinocladiella mackenziei CBS 650.93]KIX07257.1 hypothetical protein Z518_01910 [Rhinocladiella mackenziei CBS 650.93]
MAFFPTLARRAAAKAVPAEKDTVLKKGARRDPELYILLGIMSGAFGLAGFYFGRKPTSATSEAEVSVANSSMPWEVDHDHEDQTKHFKYQYHPKGDRSQTPRNAPSALNTVIVPNVTLPKDVHDKLNKWGKEGY